MSGSATSEAPRPDADSDNCPTCGHAVDDWVDRCRHCQGSVDFPNVRLCMRQTEIDALESRYIDAVHATSDIQKDRVFAYQSAVATNSKAVFNRTLAVLATSLSSEDDISNNFYAQVDAALRLPQSDEWNKVRVVADNIAFPGFSEKIRFAALSLTDQGLTNYGGCSVVVKTEFISARATVMDQNSVTWVNSQIAAGDLFSGSKLIPGYRATWKERGRLAVAKLGTLVGRDPDPDDAALLLKNGATSADDEFIEVHIWGQLTAIAIELIVIPKPTSSRDKLYRDVLIERIDALGVQWRDAS